MRDSPYRPTPCAMTCAVVTSGCKGKRRDGATGLRSLLLVVVAGALELLHWPLPADVSLDTGIAVARSLLLQPIEKSIVCTMDHVLSAVLLAASSNIDNLGVGVAYGVGGRTIPMYANLLTALVSGGGTLVSLAAGEWVNDFMSEEVANVVGSGIMMLIGIITLVLAIRGADNRPGDGGPDPSQVGSASIVGAREATALAVSLTLNNLGLGLGAGISHVSIPLATGLTMVVSVAAIVVGHLLGRRASLTISKRWLGVASGLLMVALGTYECFV